MPIKIIPLAKSVESEDTLKISAAVKEQIFLSVKEQFSETAKLPEEYAENSNKINYAAYAVLRTGYRANEYFSAVSGRYILKNKNWEIRELLLALCEKAKPFFARNGIKLSCKFPTVRVIVNIDEEKFYYALLEILLNAAENSFLGGEIKIGLSLTPKYVKIEITDNGKGMDKKTLKRCTEAFFKGSGEDRPGSMGLGLVIFRHFVAESGGKVMIASKEGKGTCVSFSLPYLEAGETLTGFSKAEVLGGKFSPVDIILSAIEKPKVM